jgi:hypothetical protein
MELFVYSILFLLLLFHLPLLYLLLFQCNASYNYVFGVCKAYIQ